jgi:pimeloyl-ACP methyl ester carboxylesterase
MKTIRTFGAAPAVLAAVLLGLPLAATAAVAAPTPVATTDTTSPLEAHRVDRVPTPKPDWFDCSSLYDARDQCASVDLPLDYDHPTGAKTSVSMLRVKATDQKHKIGTLFVNPGGPGASGVEMASAAPYFLGPDVLARFDVVGIDPRGVNVSDNVRCWKNVGAQAGVLSALDISFPWTTNEKNAYVKSSRAFGRACSTTGQPLASAISTAEVARDMDVLRRAVGDKKLTYLGFSYGTYLGNVYANLFPDRVRAITIDGVLDPVAWAGTTRRNLTVPQTALIRSGQGAARAMHEILVRCGRKGPRYCQFAGAGDPVKNYASIMASLKKGPLKILDPDTGEEIDIDYPYLVGALLNDLYDPDGASLVDSDLSYVEEAMQPTAGKGSAAAAKRAAARAALVEKVQRSRTAARSATAARARQRAGFGFAFPYDNSLETFQTVLCTDGVNPPDAASWPGYADANDKLAPDFGRLWTWSSAPCASKTWTAHDEDAYRGAFTHRTVNPVLVVGDYWDPATNYDNAVKVASMLPNSRLLKSNSWGHTAYGTSACVTDAVDSYLLSGKPPAAGTRCVGDDQPFTTPIDQQRRSAARRHRGHPAELGGQDVPARSRGFTLLGVRAIGDFGHRGEVERRGSTAVSGPSSYASGWRRFWGGTIAVCWAVSALAVRPGVLLGTGMTGAFAAGVAALVISSDLHESLAPRLHRLRSGMVWGAATMSAVVFLGAVSGSLLVRILLLALVSSPPVVVRVRRLVARVTRHSEDAAARLPIERSGHEVLRKLSTAELCQAWCSTHHRLSSGPPAAEVAAYAGLRRLVLEELERRHPLEVAQWLAAGGRADEAPARFLPKDPLGG